MGELIKVTPLNDEAEVWDSPLNCQWLIGVDIGGMVFVLKAPNIHPGFLEGSCAEEFGLPPDLPEQTPGIYNIICDYAPHVDWESGKVDDYSFEIKSITQIMDAEQIASYHEK